MKRNAVIVVVLVGLGVLGYFLYQRGSSDDTASVDPDDTPVPANTTPTPAPATGSDQPFMDMPTSQEDDPIGNLRLEGQVLDDLEHGVGGAIVSISANPPRTTTTEDDGSFHFEQLIAREYFLTAVAGDMVGGQQHSLTADSAPVIIRVREGSRVEITVVDAKTTTPIPNASVELRGLRDVTETTDKRGVAAFRGVPHGFTVVHASAEGHAPTDALVQVPNTPGGTIEQTVALEGGAPVAGRVIDTSGQPIANARVHATDAGGLFSMANPWKDGAVTGADGSFRIPAVAGGTWRISAHHEGYPKASSDPITLDGVQEHTGVVIEMPAGVTLSGKVVTADGKPGTWATVRVGPKNWSAWSGGWEGVRQATADETGAFEFKAMRREAVVAMASGEHTTSESIVVDLKARGSVDDAVLTLSVDGVIAGVVVDGGGNPVAEANVSAQPDFLGGSRTDDWAVRGLGSAITDGDGGFEFRGMTDGSYLLRADRSANAGFDWYALTQGVRAKTGDTDVKIVLEAEGGLEGKVQFKDGKTPDVFTISIGYTAPRPGGKKGTFRVEGLPGGKYDVAIRGAGFATKTIHDVTVVGGEMKDMGTIEVVAGRAVSGRVIDGSGAPVEGANVLVGRQLFSDGSSLGGGFGGMMDEQMGIRRVKSDANGAFRITGISKKESSIAAEHPDVGRSAFQTIRPGDEDARVELALIPFGSLQGKVTAGGEKVGGATVMAGQAGSPSPAMVTADADGKYVVAKLPAGDYTISAMIQEGFTGGQSTSRTTTVTAGAPTTLDIDIDVGTITFTVNIEGKDGAKIDMAQVFLAEGKWSFPNAMELNKAFFGGAGGSAQFKLALDGKQSKFTRVKPGSYSACVIPIAGDMNDQRTMQRLQQSPELLKVYCHSATIADAPAEQSMTAVVPAMEPIPAEQE